MDDGATAQETSPGREVLAAVVSMLTVWIALLGGRWLEPLLGAQGAVVAAFTAAAALVWWTRVRKEPPLGGVMTPLGVVLGFVALSFWLVLIWTLGSAVGLEPTGRRYPPGGQPLMLLGTLVLAPFFEELLYRERLLLALRDAIGAPLGITLSSVCFALPHLQGWSVLGTFVVGLFLGSAMLWTRSIALCIGIHAGLNLAAAACGIPPTRWVLHWVPSALLSGALLWLAARWNRRSPGVGAQ